jgi:squalene cyclase
VTRAGYALWALEVGGWEPDDTTAAVADFLLTRDREADHWRTSSNRPPSESSAFTTTALALRGLRAFGPPGQEEKVEARKEKVRGWLAEARPRDTEDRVFRLWGLKLASAAPEAIEAAARELRETQKEDGGWAQLPDGESDAYATGSALVALHEAGGLATSEPCYRRGLAFLIESQREDGSWHVASRSRPFQTYFESGFPHGKDQFISMAASGWATAALALDCPPAVTAPPRPPGP